MLKSIEMHCMPHPFRTTFDIPSPNGECGFAKGEIG